MKKIINAVESRELSVLAAEEFKKDVLERPIFKGVVLEIEEAVLQGLNEYSRISSEIGNERIVAIISTELEREGYDCKIVEQEYGLSGWDSKENISKFVGRKTGCFDKKIGPVVRATGPTT